MEYLVRKNSPRVAHIFVNGDTCCRLYSTGGLSQKKYRLTLDPQNLPICHMCQEVLTVSQTTIKSAKMSWRKKRLAALLREQNSYLKSVPKAV